VVLRVLLMPAAPSDDLARYRWEGRLVANGVSPYQAVADDPVYAPWQDGLWAEMNHRDKPTAYPPLAELGFAALASVSLEPLWFKAVFVAADVAIVAIVLMLLKGQGRPLRWAGLYAFNPVVLVGFAAEAHFDVWMVLALAATAGALQARRPLLAAAALGAAVQLKVIALLGLPFLVKREGWRTLWPFGLVLVLPSLPFAGELDKLVAGVLAFGTERAFNGGLHELIFEWTESRDAANRFVAVALALVLGGRWFGARFGSWVSDWRWACGALLLFSPTLHFWYLSWLLPFLALAPRLSWLLFSASLSVYFYVWQNEGWTGYWGLTHEQMWLLWLPLYLVGAYELRLLIPKLFAPAWFLQEAPDSTSSPGPAQMGLVVVIPTLNAASTLPACLHALKGQSRPADEVIVVDGGSTDATVTLATVAGARVTTATGGRGAQIAAGVSVSTRRIAVAVHADAVLSPDALGRIERVMGDASPPAGGCLGQRFDRQGWVLLSVEVLNEMRATLGGVAFGDQILFWDRKVLPDADLPGQPLMEDVELGLRLLERGSFAYAGSEAVVSAQKWQRGRSWRRFRQVIGLVARYRLARLVSRERASQLSRKLFAEYYGLPPEPPQERNTILPNRSAD
ncbi:MAG: glycosyltransferase, partial [Opitutales bacterium]